MSSNSTTLRSDELKYRSNGGSTYALTLRGDLEDAGDFSHRRRYERDILTGCLRAKHTATSRKPFKSTKPGTTEPVSRFYSITTEFATLSEQVPLQTEAPLARPVPYTLFILVVSQFGKLRGFILIQTGLDFTERSGTGFGK